MENLFNKQSVIEEMDYCGKSGLCSDACVGSCNDNCSGCTGDCSGFCTGPAHVLHGINFLS